MQTIRISTSQNIDIDYEVAPVGDRILGYMIDGAMFFILYIITLITVLASGKLLSSRIGLTTIIIVFVLLLSFYDLVCEIFMNGQSVGKRIMKTRVISLSGGRPSISQFAIRWLLRLVDMTLTTCLGALISIIVSEKNQRLGDIAAGTVVVKTTQRTGSSHLSFHPNQGDYVPVFSRARQLSDEDVKLIHEVLRNVYKSRNLELLSQMADKVKTVLDIIAPEGMGDHLFLTTIIKDYNHIPTEE